MKTLDNARILSRGKSFEHSEWSPYVQYTNDCLKQDFVTYNNALYACAQTHLSIPDEPPTLTDNKYWSAVVHGSAVYIPVYDDETGELNWIPSNGVEDIKPVTIRIIGPWQPSDGEDSTGLGTTNKTTGDYSVASGFESLAKGDGSHALGWEVNTTNKGELAIGHNNKSSENTIFSIGNGLDKPSNLFEIQKDGSIFLLDKQGFLIEELDDEEVKDEYISSISQRSGNLIVSRKKIPINRISDNNLLSLSDDGVIEVVLQLGYDLDNKSIVLIGKDGKVITSLDISIFENRLQKVEDTIIWEEY